MPYGMACSTSDPVKKKRWSSTCTGCPRERHSRRASGSHPAAHAFGVHTDHRLTGGLILLDLLVEMAKLRIPVRVLLAFPGLDVGLEGWSPAPSAACPPSAPRRDGLACRVSSSARCRSDLVVHAALVRCGHDRGH
jgi:hypothetical protein